ncbi:MAG: ATP-binding cassette domain-containing protein [Candidatus Saccharibacteria bacterium]|nr:ATP-binding cassette domain-containing protein [Candidatus Saccharibacteria bacterium]
MVVTGPNGSGKSYLAKCIVGINKISSGKIIFEDEDISEKDCTDRARLGMAYSFQQPVHFKDVTIRDLLMIDAGGEKVDKYLKKVGLESELYLDCEVSGSLSGGELKRIEIASVIARNAELIHEAAIGKIAGEQLIKLMTLGLSRRQAESQIINGFLK